jgi:seryl-tRNA synthetase
MIDLHLLRQDSATIIDKLNAKDPSFEGEKLYQLDQHYRELKAELEQLQHQKNELAHAAKKGITQDLREESILVGKKIKTVTVCLEEVEQQFNALYLQAPNIATSDVPIGGKEQNKVVLIEGEKPTFSFTPKNHTELGALLGWFDFPTAAKISGTNFALYKEPAVKMLYALSMFMLEHNKEYGFEYVLPPYLVNQESLYVSGNFPKFKDQVYKAEDEDLYLIPTSEVALVNYYREHIFAQEDLPKRMTSWTSCFRKEAGGYGAQERGLIRLHQFEKVELVSFVEPEKADEELELMLKCAQAILKKLNLHYRISLLATGDTSFQSAKTYDIEVWMPGQDAYFEVSSVSNCTDFQARRGKIRYRKNGVKKPQLVYTLNASSLALPRLMVALIETYQKEDGNIEIPDILKQYWLP